MKLLPLLTVIVFGLTACGQKGALYLPERPQKSPSNEHAIYTDEFDNISDDPNDF